MKKHIYLFIFFLLEASILFASVDNNKVFLEYSDKLTPIHTNADFYWNTFIISDNSVLTKPDTSMHIPGLWNDKNKFSYLGYGTYQFYIEVDKRYIGSYIGFKMTDFPSAYKFYIDKVLIFSNGKIGKNRNEEIPEFKPNTFFYKVEKETLPITIEISNYHNSKGGPWGLFYVGKHEIIKEKRERDLVFQIFLTGSLFSMFCYYMFFAIVRKDKLSSLSFSLLCLNILVRTILTGERYINNILPNLSWEFVFKIEYITFFMGVGLYIIYVSSLFESIRNKTIVSIFFCISLGFSLVTLFTNALVYTQLGYIFEIFSIFLIAYSLYLMLKAIINKQKYSFFIFLSSIIIIISYYIDILYASGKIYTGYTLGYAFTFFIISQTLILAKQFDEEYKTIEKLSIENMKMYEDVTDLNKNLEKKVAERTIELNEAIEKLNKMIIIDSMTKLYNRKFLFKKLNEEVEKYKRYYTPFSVLILDIDWFKRVNDNFGHLVGDEVLIKIAASIRENIRITDIATRFGGEEFVILLPMTKAEQAFIVGEKLRKEVENCKFDNLNLKVTISVGVAEYHGLGIESLLEEADNKLYKAKDSGRNKTVV